MIKKIYYYIENMSKHKFIDDMCEKYNVTRDIIIKRIEEVRVLNKE